MSVLTSCMCKNEKSVNPYFISLHIKIWSNEPTMRHKYLTMSPLFLGNILYPIRQNLLNVGHSYLIRVVDSELCHLTTSRNNKKAILCIGNEARANILWNCIHIYLLFHDCSLFLVLMERDLEEMERDLEDVFRSHFQNHHRRFNPFLGSRRPS